MAGGQRIPEEATGLIRAYFSETDERAWLGLLEAHARVVRALDRELISSHQLSLSAFETLISVAHADGGAISISALSDAVNLSPSHTSRLVIELEGRGLVERRRRQADGRSTEAVMTPAGIAALHAIGPTYLQAVRRQFHDRLSESELAALAAIWDRLTPPG